MVHGKKSTRDLFLRNLSILSRQCPGVQLTEDDVELYERALAPLGYARVAAALEHIVINRKGTDRFPSIADIRQVLEPKTDERATAVEVVGRIFDAMSNPGSGLYKLGQEWDEHWAKVTGKIGEVGVEVVKRMGGWAELCRVAGDESQTVLRAQLRDIADAVIKRAAAGKLSEAPTLPQPFGQPAKLSGQVASLLPNLTKDMPKDETK